MRRGPAAVWPQWLKDSWPEEARAAVLYGINGSAMHDAIRESERQPGRRNLACGPDMNSSSLSVHRAVASCPRTRWRKPGGPWTVLAAAIIVCWLIVFRFGEASHPGPSRRRYADPSKPGFRSAHATDGVLADARAQDTAAAAAAADDGQFALEVVTANTTGWGPLKRYLGRTTAHVVLAQEHRLRGERVDEASEWARRQGWKSLWADAAKGDGDGTRGGVAIFVRDSLGLRPPPWGDPVVEEARILAATVEAPGHRPTIYSTMYLEDGTGLAPRNRAYMAKLGQKFSKSGTAVRRRRISTWRRRPLSSAGI